MHGTKIALNVRVQLRRRWAFQKGRSRGDIFLILDADFAPRPDFLRETIPYFLEDPKIAILQTPQFFTVDKRQTWVEQGAGVVQEPFYRLVQVNLDRWGASVCVGTNALYRRAALAPHGGIVAIEHSEDVYTGVKMVDSGWKVLTPCLW